MITQKFQIGDSVKLIDGKIKMSINKVITESDLLLAQVFNGYYECVYEENNKVVIGKIHQDLIASS